MMSHLGGKKRMISQVTRPQNHSKKKNRAKTNKSKRKTKGAKSRLLQPPRRNKDERVRGHTYDPRQTLDSRAGHTRSIYGSRGRASRHDDGHLFVRDKPNHARAECRGRTPSELRRDAARYRGAAHPLCFTDEVLDHEFPEGIQACQH